MRHPRHVLHGLAENPAAPAELVDRLIAVADDDLADYLANRPDLTCEQVLALGRLEEGNVPPDWTRILADHPDIQVVAELAIVAPAEIAAELAAHPHAEVRLGAAANASLSPALLGALLTGDGLAPARSCLVCDQEPIPFVHDPYCDRADCSLPPGAACDGSHESTRHQIRQVALNNPATPADVAAGFVDHPSYLLRYALAERTDLPSQSYARLADDAMPGVRSTVAQNPAIGQDVMRALATDRGHDVQRRLAHNPNVPIDILVQLADVTKIGSTLLPRIAAADTDEVEKLASSRSPTVRMLLAQRRDLPPAIRDALSEDPDAKVAKSIAPHPGLSDARLRALIARHGSRVLAFVAANPHATPALLEDLTRHDPVPYKALREIARHPNATAVALSACLADRKARIAAAGHPALSVPEIIDLLADDDWQVVEAAAANPSLPPSVMAELVVRCQAA